MALDPHLTDLMRTALKGRRGLREQRMFGGCCWMVDGNMLCGISGSRFLFRVGKEGMPEALTRPGAEPMAVGGRKLGGFVWVDADAAIDAGLADWIAVADRFVATLPPKAPGGATH